MIQEFFARYIPLIEAEMSKCLTPPDPSLDGLYGMLQYHMGWMDERLAPLPSSSKAGKRIRPVMCLLACQAAGGDPLQAVPAAAGVELLHNFSLIHDDIEDRSPTRRGRRTIWSLWGIPQAINAGDALFTIAHMSVDRAAGRGVSPERLLAARDLFGRACLNLTHGQYLDLSFESRDAISVGEYLYMISGKTSALLGAAVAMGATVAGSRTVEYYGTFGRELGMAFQILDDILGIWGDEALLGKSTESDVSTRKKTLPIVYGLEQSARLRDLFAQPQVDVLAAVAELNAVGAREFAEDHARQYHERSLAALEQSDAAGPAGQALKDLAESLLHRSA